MEKLDTSQINEWPNDVILGSAKISDESPSHILSPQEQDEFSRFKNPDRKAEYISARYLFRFLLAEMNLDNEGIELLKDKGGKPYAKFQDEIIHVSFSHSPEKVFCSVSSRMNIGLDVEHIHRKMNEAVVKRILSDAEYEEVGREDPLKLWTIKEAAVKCLGTGLRTNLKDLTIIKNKKKHFSVRFNNDKLFKICSFKQLNHQIALAYQSQQI